jgi:hypothetical protein
VAKFIRTRPKLPEPPMTNSIINDDAFVSLRVLERNKLNDAAFTFTSTVVRYSLSSK